MFIFAQFKITKKYNDPKEFKKLKIHFHEVLGKKQEDVWSLVKIVKIISITLDTLFEGVLQNYRYSVVRANNVLFDFTIGDFPLINLNDLITITKIMGNIHKHQVQDKPSYIIGYGHTKSFLDYYTANLALTKFELANVFNKNSKVPKSLLKGKFNIND